MQPPGRHRAFDSLVREPELLFQLPNRHDTVLPSRQ
jgi:hypothetical protein